MLFWYYFVNFNVILEDLSSSELPVGPMSLDHSGKMKAFSTCL